MLFSVLHISAVFLQLYQSCMKCHTNKYLLYLLYLRFISNQFLIYIFIRFTWNVTQALHSFVFFSMFDILPVTHLHRYHNHIKCDPRCASWMFFSAWYLSSFLFISLSESVGMVKQLCYICVVFSVWYLKSFLFVSLSKSLDMFHHYLCCFEFFFSLCSFFFLFLSESHEMVPQICIYSYCIQCLIS